MESQTSACKAAKVAALQALVPPVGMTPLAWVALGVGLGQLVLLTVGLVLMYRSNTSREQQTQALTLATARRHDETMEAFRLQAAASREQHVETLEALRQQSDALRQQSDALRTLIERTAPSRA